MIAIALFFLLCVVVALMFKLCLLEDRVNEHGRRLRRLEAKDES